MWPFGGYEFVQALVKKREDEVAALTPEQRAWLSAEEDWRHTIARREQEARHNLAKELDQLLEDDIRRYGHAL